MDNSYIKLTQGTPDYTIWIENIKMIIDWYIIIVVYQ